MLVPLFNKVAGQQLSYKNWEIFKNSFFHKIAPVAASEKIHKSQENISDGGVIIRETFSGSCHTSSIKCFAKTNNGF